MDLKQVYYYKRALLFFFPTCKNPSLQKLQKRAAKFLENFKGDTSTTTRVSTKSKEFDSMSMIRSDFQNLHPV